MGAAVSVLAAADPVEGWQVTGSIIVALISVVGSWYAARSTLRAANGANAIAHATAEHQRDKAIDERVDQVNARLWERLDQMETRHRAVCQERDSALERLHRLRMAVIAFGLDPDALIPPARPAPPAEPSH